jgi:hypothetical protein
MYLLIKNKNGSEYSPIDLDIRSSRNRGDLEWRQSRARLPFELILSYLCYSLKSLVLVLVLVFSLTYICISLYKKIKNEVL